MVVTVRLRPRHAKFLQRVRPKCTEREEPLRLQHASDLGESHIQWIAPLKHEAAEYDIDTRIRERQAHCIGTHPLEPPEETLPSLCFAQHSGRHINSRHQRASIPTLQLLSPTACAGAEIQHDSRLEFEKFQPTHQLLID